jgi:hypothetical protein
MKVLVNIRFSTQGSRRRHKWAVMALLTTMGFWATVDFIATIFLTAGLGPITSLLVTTDVFTDPGKIPILAPMPSILVFIAHIINVCNIHMVILCDL